jgi:hypothetical protein
MARVLDRATSGPDEFFTEENQTKTKVGPIRWMAIEMLVRQSYSPKSDVWAFAVFLWELYRRQKPWPTKTNLEVAHAVMGGEYIHLSGNGVPPYMSTLSTMCYAREPSDRPSMNAIVVELLSRWSVAGEVLHEDLESQASLPTLEASMLAEAAKTGTVSSATLKAAAAAGGATATLSTKGEYAAPPANDGRMRRGASSRRKKRGKGPDVEMREVDEENEYTVPSGGGGAKVSPATVEEGAYSVPDNISAFDENEYTVPSGLGEKSGSTGAIVTPPVGLYDTPPPAPEADAVDGEGAAGPPVAMESSASRLRKKDKLAGGRSSRRKKRRPVADADAMDDVDVPAPLPEEPTEEA